jgi:hypothetical protein
VSRLTLLFLAVTRVTLGRRSALKSQSFLNITDARIGRGVGASKALSTLSRWPPTTRDAEDNYRVNAHIFDLLEHADPIPVGEFRASTRSSKRRFSQRRGSRATALRKRDPVADKRLFVGCRLPARLVVLDRGSGRIIDTLSTVGDADDVFYDTTRRLIFVIGGEGMVEILRQRDPDHYEHAGRVTTVPGARTGFFLQNSSRLYVAVPRRGSQTAKVLVYTIAGS